MKLVMWLLPVFVATVLAIVLLVIRWRQRFHYQTLVGRNLPDSEVKRRLNAALVETDRVLTAHKIEYWLDAGTLLGAHRSRGFIPWDDDLDVCIWHADHARLLALAAEFKSPYRLIRISRWWSVDKIIPGLSMLWPCNTFLRLLDTQTQLYVDIFEATRTSDDRIELLPLSNFHRPVDVHGDVYRVDRDVVLPLTEIEFESKQYPAPHQTVKYLQAYYGTDLSPDHEWNESRGKYVAVERSQQKRSCFPRWYQG